MKLKKGDRVKVLSGKDRGEVGEIMRAIPQKDMVIVDGVNVARKSQRALRATMQAGIIDKDMPIPASKVALLCSQCDKATRIGYRFDGPKKVRICRKCGADV
ncbi:MAG: 50S ribosomal protein L24 [Acidimicrobiia bacterium]|nr:50S ribosomal protein L24 [Acidimicrobiia bacterium]